MTATFTTDGFGLRGVKDALDPSFVGGLAELRSWGNLDDVHVVQPRRRGVNDETTCVVTLVRHDGDSWCGTIVVTTTSEGFIAQLARQLSQYSTYLGTPTVVLAGRRLTPVGN